MPTKFTSKLLRIFPVWLLWICYVGYALYCLDMTKDFLPNVLFGAIIPLFLLLYTFPALPYGDKMSLAIISVLMILFITVWLAGRSSYKIWIWSAVSWAYLGLCFWCGQWMMGV